MHAATKSYQKQILVWLLWAIAIFIFVSPPEPMSDAPVGELPVLAGAIAHQRRDGPLFVWRYRLRVLIGRHGGVLRRISRRVAWAARWANWARSGALTMAQVVDWLTRAQLRRQLGALPVLYALLEVLQVRDIINRHCPTAADVDHGTVALVLILNRLVAPRPLYQVADWLSRTLLVHTLGIPADKFNDDRLGRTLDALSQHGREIWQDIVHRALVQTDIDLSVIFYDLTAFVVHGEYTASEYVDFGFAHNTPMDKRKFKVGLNAAADGSIPTLYQLWSGRTTDVATVQENMDRLSRLLAHYGRPVDEVLIIGDRANLNDKLAIVYQEKGLRYLAGLQARKTVHRELLVAYSEQQLRSYPLNTARGAAGYWGRSCPVTFEHQGQQVIHQGLVVLSGPMRSAVRKSRATKLRALHQKLREVQANTAAWRVCSNVRTPCSRAPLSASSCKQPPTWMTENKSACGGRLTALLCYQLCSRMGVISWSPTTRRFHLNACLSSILRKTAWKSASGSPRATCRSRPSTCTKTRVLRVCCSRICSRYSPTACCSGKYARPDGRSRPGRSSPSSPTWT